MCKQTSSPPEVTSPEVKLKTPVGRGVVFLGRRLVTSVDETASRAYPHGIGPSAKFQNVAVASLGSITSDQVSISPTSVTPFAFSRMPKIETIRLYDIPVLTLVELGRLEPRVG